MKLFFEGESLQSARFAHWSAPVLHAIVVLRQLPNVESKRVVCTCLVTLSAGLNAARFVLVCSIALVQGM